VLYFAVECRGRGEERRKGEEKEEREEKQWGTMRKQRGTGEKCGMGDKREGFEKGRGGVVEEKSKMKRDWKGEERVRIWRKGKKLGGQYWKRGRKGNES
jgi:hypothetical protein